jgi:hypothetical protein
MFAKRRGDDMQRFALGIVLTAALIGAGPVTAALINVTAATRQVEVGSAESNFPGPNSPSIVLGSFSDSVTHDFFGTDGTTLKPATADQSSNIQNGTGLFTGTGSASIGFSVLQTDAIFANSLFDTFFDITTDLSYSLAGQLDALVDGGRAEARFQLDGPTPLDFDTVGGLVSLLSSGVLLAGSYHLTVSAVMDNGGVSQPDAAMGGSSSFGFEFQLTEGTPSVPEPAALALLFAAGIAGFGYRNRCMRPRPR